jgi:hypothetical protein
VDGSGPFGQGHDDDIRDFNKPPAGHPGLWCWWEPTKDGTAIKWNGVEKFYNSEEWMSYLIDLFLKPGAVLASELAQPVPGVVDARGEDDDDRWRLVVTRNTVTSVYADSCGA